MTCKKEPVGLTIKWNPLILMEGIYCLYDSNIRDLMDLKYFTIYRINKIEYSFILMMILDYWEDYKEM